MTTKMENNPYKAMVEDIQQQVSDQYKRALEFSDKKAHNLGFEVLYEFSDEEYEESERRIRRASVEYAGSRATCNTLNSLLGMISVVMNKHGGTAQ